MAEPKRINYPTWELAPPNPSVSPLIRFSRWTLLIVGITYGFTRHRFLQRRADKNKALRDSRIEMRAKEKAEKDRLDNIENLKMLEDLCKIKLLPD